MTLPHEAVATQVADFLLTLAAGGLALIGVVFLITGAQVVFHREQSDE